MKSLMSLFIVTLASLVPYSSLHAGYLFVTFTGEETPMSEQIYFAVSDDGFEWQGLKGGNPMLVSTLGEKGVRDPYLLRSQDGSTFYLIATDLSIHLNPNWGRAVTEGSHSIVIWESQDLVHWTAPRLVSVAPEDAGCTWAPEAVYDEQTGDYLVFWASTTGRDEFQKHRIWAARTRDFREFGEPFVFVEKATAVIDTTIVREGDRYYRFTKDEKEKGITCEWAPSLHAQWQDVAGFSLQNIVGYEGPACYRLKPATDDMAPTWCLILDHYSKGTGYEPFVSKSLMDGRFEKSSAFRFPFKFRHGSVLPISDEEMQLLKDHYLEK